MSKLAAVKPKFDPTNRRFKGVIYGKAGVGKTMLAMAFENCFYVDVEGGAREEQYMLKLADSGGGYFGPEQGSQDVLAIIEQVKLLTSEKHSYKTLIIDSVSKLFNDLIAGEAEVLEASGKKNEFGLDKKMALRSFRRLVAALLHCPVNIILIAHEKALWKNSEQVGTTFDCWEKLDYEFDGSFHLIQTGDDRFLNPSKSRIEAMPVGKPFPATFDEIAERFGREALCGEIIPVTLISESQLKQVRGKLKQLGASEAEKQKILKHAQAGDLSDMTAEYAKKLLARLDTKIQQLAA